MKKIALIAIILFASVTLVQAQKKDTDANIIGHVQSEGEHVPFINVTVDGTTIGTATDGTGHYQLINLPVGELTVRVTGIGYKSKSKKNSPMLDALMSVRGAAGNRTPVQTRKPYAFYMFSPDLIFE